MDQLRATEFCQTMKGQIFFTADIAMRELADT